MSATTSQAFDPVAFDGRDAEAARIVAALERDGVVELPQLVDETTLREMQEAFDSRLSSYASGDVIGYYRTELKRRGVHDVLTLAQGFIDIGIHPLVMSVLQRYIGKTYALAEAKGWQTDRSLKDFHGWHGDAWYDQSRYDREHMPREVKLAFYLTDVKSGGFEYVRGSHRKEVPALWSKQRAQSLPSNEILRFTGKAGTAIMFDTSGVHRQGVPVLEPRRAVFYNYHDLDVALQKEDVEYYRYHPLVLNAAFLGGLGAEQQRVLGFGHKGRFRHDFVRKPKFARTHTFVSALNTAELYASHYVGRLTGAIKRRLPKAWG